MSLLLANFNSQQIKVLSKEEQRKVVGGADYYTVWVYDADGCPIPGESYSFQNYASASAYAAQMRNTSGVAAVALIGYNFP
jgi:O-phosphoseryl-tRNA(Cys) synthetase